MTIEEILQALEDAGTEKTKRMYKNNGAIEPVFGVTIKDLKPIAKKIGIDHKLAQELYQTGNYDAMYLAGMIAGSKVMTESDFEHWIEKAYFYMLSDYTVAIILAESDIAISLATKWINSGEELRASAGWSTYAWLLGTNPDDYFDYEVLLGLLNKVQDCIHSSLNRERYAMNSFLMAVGISYNPLQEAATEVARQIGRVHVNMGDTSCKVPVASEYIEKTIKQGRIGFKRKHTRC